MDDMIYIRYFKTKFGELLLGSYQNQLCLADWRYRSMRKAIDDRIQKGLGARYQEQSTPITDQCIQELKEYFAGQRTSFSFQPLLVGSDFQQSVWHALMQIPYGRTDTYLGLSKKLNNELAIRAVAAANGANALSIIIPCHRVIGSKGELTGYAGGLPAKKKLLTLEGALIQQELFS